MPPMLVAITIAVRSGSNSVTPASANAIWLAARAKWANRSEPSSTTGSIQSDATNPSTIAANPPGDVGLLAGVLANP